MGDVSGPARTATAASPAGPAAAAGSGLSGTPLAKKLGVKPGHLLYLRRPPAGWGVPGLPAGVAVARRARPRAAADVTVAFFRTRRELERDLAELTAALPAAGSLWIAWPRRAAGHASGITENTLRELLLPLGVVDVKVAALDRDWSGLKFVWRKELRK